eukprot:61691-Hanusia_phi.AAC.1
MPCSSMYWMVLRSSPSNCKGMRCPGEGTRRYAAARKSTGATRLAAANRRQHMEGIFHSMATNVVGELG